MTTTNDGGPVHPMVMKAAKSLFFVLTGVTAQDHPREWEVHRDYLIRNAQAALTACGALECLAALENLTERTPVPSSICLERPAYESATSAIAKVYGSAPE
jgi:hypothetical protein